MKTAILYFKSSVEEKTKLEKKIKGLLEDVGFSITSVFWDSRESKNVGASWRRLIETTENKNLIVPNISDISIKSSSVFQNLSTLCQKNINLFEMNRDLKPFTAIIHRVIELEKVFQNQQRNPSRVDIEKMGTTPYGFRSTTENGKRSLHIDPQESSIIQEIFQSKENGMSLSAIARNLNNRGVPTKAKKNKTKVSKWYASTVRYILSNRNLYLDIL